MDNQNKNLEDEKLGFSVTMENRRGSLELSNNRDPREVENAADLSLQSKQESSLSESLEPERPRETGNYSMRNSLAWDKAFFTSKGVLDPENDDFDLFDTGNPLDYSADIFGQRKYEYLPYDSLEPELPSGGEKFNMRQSIAWDSAFFTSEGVLDAEELFMINKGLMEAKTQLLPGIKEFQRSAESNSTIDNDSIDSLECDLFEDIRASIQKSTSKKSGSAFQTEMKTTPAIRRQTVTVCGSELTAKDILFQTPVQPIRSREPVPLPLKPKKMLAGSNSIAAATTKRLSLAADCVEVENKSATTILGKPPVVTRRPYLVNSRGIKPNSTPSPRSSSGSASAINKSTVSSSPYDRSDSASSDATGKPPSNPLRRKSNSMSMNLTPASSPKVPASATNKSTVSSSPYDRSDSASSDAIGKSPSNSLRRKSDSTGTNLTSASTLKVPRRTSTKTKNDVCNSGQSPSRFFGPVSAQKPSSRTSPNDVCNFGQSPSRFFGSAATQKPSSRTSPNDAHNSGQSPSRVFGSVPAQKPSSLTSPNDVCNSGQSPSHFFGSVSAQRPSSFTSPNEVCNSGQSPSQSPSRFFGSLSAQRPSSFTSPNEVCNSGQSPSRFFGSVSARKSSSRTSPNDVCNSGQSPSRLFGSVSTQKPCSRTSPNDVCNSGQSPSRFFGSVSAQKSSTRTSANDACNSDQSPSRFFNSASAQKPSSHTSPNDVCNSGQSPNRFFGSVSAQKPSSGTSSNDVCNSGQSPSRFFGSVSAQNPSFSASLTSSFEGWSSESSSSTVHQRSNGSEASLDGVPFRGIPFYNDSIQELDIESHSPKQSSVGSQSHRLLNQGTKKCSKVDGPVSSSLRMPSPKIGFFDVEKSTPTRLNENLQFHFGAPSTLSKSSARISDLGGAPNRARRGKLQAARTSIGTENVKQGSHITEGPRHDSGTNPTIPVQLEDDASKKNSGLLRTTRIHLEMTAKDQNVSSTEVNRANCSKIPEVGSSPKAGNKGGQAIPKGRMRNESKGRVLVKGKKTLTKEGSTSMNLQRKEHEEACSPQDNHFDDQVDGLSRQLCVIALTKDADVDTKGNMSCSNSDLTVNNSGGCYLQQAKMRLEQDEEKA